MNILFYLNCNNSCRSKISTDNFVEEEKTVHFLYISTISVFNNKKETTVTNPYHGAMHASDVLRNSAHNTFFLGCRSTNM